MKRAICVAAVLACSLHALIGAQQVGVNVNVLSGTEERTGDAFAQRENEAVVAISTRNSDHIMVAMNDYRTVDVAFDTSPEESGPNGVMARRLGARAQGVVAQSPPEAWIGLAFSRDRGRTWYTGLLPGYPQDPTAVGKASPVYGDSAGSDPVLITGKNGRVYLVALTFDRGGISRISATRYTDRNNVEGGEAFYFDHTKQIDRGSMASKGRFADKPSGAAYAGDNSGVSTGGASNRRRGVTTSPGCERVYTAYTVFEGNDATGNFRNNVMLSLSADCGVSWSAPAKISGPYSVGGVNYPGTRNQGTTMAVDPDTGHVYVAWRTYEPNGFVLVKSVDGGLSFSAPKLLASGVTPYDQTLRTINDGTNVTTFRSNAYPSMVIYAGQPVVAWQERVDANGNSSAAGVPRVVMTKGQYLNGVLVWSPRFPADLGDVGASPGTRCESELPENALPTTEPVTVCRPTGAQVMPSLSVRTGQLAIAYYESRHQEADPVNGDTAGAPGGLAPATGEISGMHRQLDTRVALYNADTFTKTQSFQVSRYPIDPATGRIKENPSAPDPKLKRQVNYPNYPMYRGGLAAFVGDYLHGIPLRADGSSPGFRFVFTSNELVVPPPDLDFTKYSKPQQGVLSECNPGSRNATIMTAEVGTGLVVGSPGTFKQLVNSANQPVQRAFAVYVENHTPAYRGFRMTLVHPADVTASFEQFGPPVTTVDVEVLASSSITRTVYLSGANPAGSATVNVSELQLQVSADRPTVAPTLNLAASLILNGDSTNPPVGGVGGNPNLANLETHTPQLGTPQLGTPQLGTAAVTSPQLGTPQLGTPQLGTPQLGTPQVSTPQLGTTGPSDPSITDITYSVTNEGNTASAFNSLVSMANAPNLSGAGGHTFQVLVYRVHQSATVSGCEIAKAQQDQIVYMTPQLGTPQLGTPQLGTPQLGTPQLGTPQLGTPQLGTPQLGTTQLATASFSIAPGDPTPDDHDGTEHQHQDDDELRLTVRVRHPHGENVAAAHPNLVHEVRRGAVGDRRSAGRRHQRSGQPADQGDHRSAGDRHRSGAAGRRVRFAVQHHAQRQRRPGSILLDRGERHAATGTDAGLDDPYRHYFRNADIGADLLVYRQAERFGRQRRPGLLHGSDCSPGGHAAVLAAARRWAGGQEDRRADDGPRRLLDALGSGGHRWHSGDAGARQQSHWRDTARHTRGYSPDGCNGIGRLSERVDRQAGRGITRFGGRRDLHADCVVHGFLDRGERCVRDFGKTNPHLRTVICGRPARARW
jgi:hypothetical protein